MKHLAALGAVIAALIITVPGAADTDTGWTSANPAVNATFTVTRDHANVWHAQVIISEAPPPPPASTADLYHRVIEREGATRAQAISRLTIYLGALVGTGDLEFQR